MYFHDIEEIVADIKQGKCVIVLDDEDRENEGDLVCAAETVTPEIINFMAGKGKGMICAPLAKEYCQKLDLPLMVEEDSEFYGCRFTIPVDLKEGTTTGISASDRAKTIRALCNKNTQSTDFNKPGHVFPLMAEPKGLAVRHGHTEASIYLTQLAGLKPAAVICEILKDDGEMARLNDLIAFSKEHNIKLTHVKELIDHFQKNVS